MPLSKKELVRMEHLLGKSKFNNLSNGEESELRNIIQKEQPYAEDSSTDDLIKLGLILVGIYLLAKAFE